VLVPPDKASGDPFGDLPAIAQIPDAKRAAFHKLIGAEFSKWATFQWEAERSRDQEDFVLYEGIENAARLLSEQLIDAEPWWDLGFAPPMKPAALRIFRKQLAKTATWAHGCKQDVAECAAIVTRRGPKGSRNSPKIGDLVISFEMTARSAGGRFTRNKRNRKGSLLDALDNVMARLLATPPVAWMAKYLPVPDQHPVATYERALIKARRLARLGTPPN
jgi:hypothetical protein